MIGGRTIESGTAVLDSAAGHSVKRRFTALHGMVVRDSIVYDHMRWALCNHWRRCKGVIF